MKCLLVGVIYPLSRRPAFIGINKANVSVCLVGVTFVGGGVVLVSMIFGGSFGDDDALGDPPLRPPFRANPSDRSPDGAGEGREGLLEALRRVRLQRRLRRAFTADSVKRGPIKAVNPFAASKQPACSGQLADSVDTGPIKAANLFSHRSGQLCGHGRRVGSAPRIGILCVNFIRS